MLEIKGLDCITEQINFNFVNFKDYNVVLTIVNQKFKSIWI